MKIMHPHGRIWVGLFILTALLTSDCKTSKSSNSGDRNSAASSEVSIDSLTPYAGSCESGLSVSGSQTSSWESQVASATGGGVCTDYYYASPQAAATVRSLCEKAAIGSFGGVNVTSKWSTQKCPQRGKIGCLCNVIGTTEGAVGWKPTTMGTDKCESNEKNRCHKIEPRT